MSVKQMSAMARLDGEADRPKIARIYEPGYLELETYVAREFFGVTDAWRAHTMRRNSDRSLTFKGANIYRALGGGHDGRYMWVRPMTGELEFTLLPHQLDAVRVHYQRDTGKCVSCLGRGTVPAAWDATIGTLWSTCGVCRGSGKATIPPAVETAR